jgi:hypothetical protein
LNAASNSTIVSSLVGWAPPLNMNSRVTRWYSDFDAADFHVPK